MDIMLREFGRYVRDEQRTALFAQAIAATVRPGDVVVDLGAGFGLLSLLCARQGAARVYAIEQGPYVELGKAISSDNGLADRIVWIAGNSAAIQLPELADVIVSETLGQWALEEYTVEYLFDAKHRFGKPGVRIVPHTLSIAVVPVSAPHLRRQWNGTYGPQWADVHGFNLTRLRQSVFANEVSPYTPVSADEVIPLAVPVDLASFHLGTTASSRFICDVSVKCTSPGECDGWLGMFSAALSPSITLSTWPGEQPTHWGNVLFPLCPPRPIEAGQPLSARFGFLGARGWLYEVCGRPPADY